MTNPFKEPILKASLKSIALVLIAVTPIVYGFYYNTNQTLKVNTKKISEIEESLDTIKESVVEDKVFKGTSRLETNQLKEKVNDIDDKLDLMLKIMGDFIIEDRRK